jgi:hypothetical protein
MKLDIRLPLGLMFVIIGSLLLLAGVLNVGEPANGVPESSINLWWGMIMLLFGGVMLWLSKR